MNIQSHFAKYLDKPIWNKTEEVKVTLVALRKNNLVFVNGTPNEEHEGDYYKFQVIAKDEKEVIDNQIPIDLAVIEVEQTTVRKPALITPEGFLKKLKEIIYPPRNLTDEVMWKNRKKRLREYCIPRQVIMAAYACAFSKDQEITLAKSGAIYGLDHCTVIHAIKVCNELIETNRPFREEYTEIWEMVKAVNPKSKLNI